VLGLLFISHCLVIVLKIENILIIASRIQDAI